jgi:pentose-5-phosphate-3-epimerase
MASIVPTVTAYSLEQYQSQLERLSPFAARIHLDFMDGQFAAATSLSLSEAWLPPDKHIDIHLMFRQPADQLARLAALKPGLVILQAEAAGNFQELAGQLRAADMKVGLAVLPATELASMQSALHQIDHLLIFSGSLGHFGGYADLSLLRKVREARAVNPGLEIGWDGGIHEQNARQLVEGGVDVLNVGGFIQRADDPQNAYDTLIRVINSAD